MPWTFVQHLVSRMEQTDIVDQVRQMAAGSATVKGLYGGVEIRIDDHEAFPWAEVLHALTHVGQDVWVKRIDGQLMIRSKPPAI